MGIPAANLARITPDTMGALSPAQPPALCARHETTVVVSETVDRYGIRRARRCLACSHVFTTYELAGVSRRTIYNWLNAGKLRYRRTTGGQVRIYPTSLFMAPQS